MDIELKGNLERAKRILEKIKRIESIVHFREIIKLDNSRSDLKSRPYATNYFKYYFMKFPVIYAVLPIDSVLNFSVENLNLYIDNQILYYLDD